MLQFLTYLFIAIYTATVIGIILVVILGNRNPLKTIPWVVVLIFAPVVGLVFYFFFGQDLRRKRIISRRTYKRLMVYALPAHVRRSDAPVPAACQSLSTLLTNTSQAVSFYGSRLTHYGDGASKMTALLEEIEKARDHIHILYYIFCDDETGARLQQALIRKAKEGVKVRVLYDDVGCNGVKKEFFQQMRDAGAEVHALLHVRFPMLTDRVNYRNHRKIVVIDGRVGFFGGMNIADRYVKGPGWGGMAGQPLQGRRKGGVWPAIRISGGLVDRRTRTSGYLEVFSRSRQLYLIDHAIRYQRSVGALANVVAGYYDGYRRCATEYLHPDALFPADRGPELPVANGGIGRY